MERETHFDHGGSRHTSSFKSRDLCDEATRSMMERSRVLKHNIMMEMCSFFFFCLINPFEEILLSPAALLGLIRDKGHLENSDLPADLNSSHLSRAHVSLDRGPPAEGWPTYRTH